jgi:hypothetical protein
LDKFNQEHLSTGSLEIEKLERKPGMQEAQIYKDSTKSINPSEIRKRIQKALDKNSYLSETLANVKTNLDSLCLKSRIDNFEISKRQEKVSKKVQKVREDGEMTPNFASHLPTLDTLDLPQIDVNHDENKNYYETISKLLSKNSQPQANLSKQFTAQLTPDVGFMLKSMVMQDLFTTAFRRLLHTSKPIIIQNLSTSLGFNMSCPPPIPMNSARRNSKVNRKNTDVMSTDTIETDVHANLVPSSSQKDPKVARRNQINLSAFFPHSKKGSDSMVVPGQKQDKIWDPREETKQ